MVLRRLVMWMNQQRNSMKLQSTWREGEEEDDLPRDLLLV